MEAELSRHNAEETSKLVLDMKRFSMDPPNLSILKNFTQLRELSMVNVGLLHLNGFPHLPNLSVLCLGDNKISNVHGLVDARLHQLESLDLSNNKIQDFKSIEMLQNLQVLRHLTLLECPITRLEAYREVTFDMLSQLMTLDGKDLCDFADSSDYRSNGNDVESDEEEEEDEDEEEDRIEDEEEDRIEDEEEEESESEDQSPNVRRGKSHGKTGKTYGGKGKGKGKHIYETLQPPSFDEHGDSDSDEEGDADRAEDDESDEDENDDVDEGDEDEDEIGFPAESFEEQVDPDLSLRNSISVGSKSGKGKGKRVQSSDMAIDYNYTADGNEGQEGTLSSKLEFEKEEALFDDILDSDFSTNEHETNFSYQTLYSETSSKNLTSHREESKRKRDSPVTSESFADNSFEFLEMEPNEQELEASAKRLK